MMSILFCLIEIYFIDELELFASHIKKENLYTREKIFKLLKKLIIQKRDPIIKGFDAKAMY